MRAKYSPKILKGVGNHMAPLIGYEAEWDYSHDINTGPYAGQVAFTMSQNDPRYRATLATCVPMEDLQPVHDEPERRVSGRGRTEMSTLSAMIFGFCLLLLAVAGVIAFVGVEMLAVQIITYLDKGTSTAFTGIDVIRWVDGYLRNEAVIGWSQAPGSWKGMHDLLFRMPAWGLLFLVSFVLLILAGKISDSKLLR